MLPEFPAGARISQYVCNLEYLFSRLNVGSFMPANKPLWLVACVRSHRKTWEDHRAMSERYFQKQ